MRRLHAFILCRLFVASCACGVIHVRAQATSPEVADTVPRQSADAPVELERVEVTAKTDDAGHDGTGMGSYEHQLRDAAFSNDMISAEAMEDDPAAVEIATELGIIATPSAVDLATGDSRVGLRGFPTPQL